MRVRIAILRPLSLFSFGSQPLHFARKNTNSYGKLYIPTRSPSSGCVAGKDTIEIMKWNTSNFEGLVLGCIDSYDSEKRRIFQDFSSSTWFLCLRTANTSKFQENNVKRFGRNEMKFHIVPILVDEFGHFSAKCWWNFVRISRIFSENDEMSRDSHK